MGPKALRFSDALVNAVWAAGAAVPLLKQEQILHMSSHLRAILDANARRPRDDVNADGTVLISRSDLLALGEHARAAALIVARALRQQEQTEELRAKLSALEAADLTLLLSMAEIAAARPIGEQGG